LAIDRHYHFSTHGWSPCNAYIGVQGSDEIPPPRFNPLPICRWCPCDLPPSHLFPQVCAMLSAEVRPVVYSQ